jgi:hypothetical protein
VTPAETRALVLATAREVAADTIAQYDALPKGMFTREDDGYWIERLRGTVALLLEVTR